MPEQNFTQLKKCWGNHLISPQSKTTECALETDAIVPFLRRIPHTACKRNITRVEQYAQVQCY